MRCFPVQQKEGCQRKRQGLPQAGASSLLIGFRRTPLLDFMMFSLLCLFLTLPQASHAAVGDEPVTLPPKPCVNTLNTLPEMQLIPAGQFQMGSPDSEEGRSNDEGPVHAVSIYRPFALSRCEITVGQFKRFVSETGYQTDAERGDGCYVLNEAADEFEPKKGTNWRSPNVTQTDDHPVVCVSWQDAKAYTRWLSAVTGVVYRLPTEAEWEYAARTTTASELSRYWGDDDPNGCAYANGAHQTLKEAIPAFNFAIAECQDGAVYTQLTGAYQRNAFGLSDMLGNAWEWVEDCYTDNYDGAPIDGSARQEEVECATQVLRGGGWFNEPGDIRSAGRSGGDPDVAFDSTGFRIARAL
jgi:formylglycine-generating enzyme required for sulfatase activity